MARTTRLAFLALSLMSSACSPRPLPNTSGPATPSPDLTSAELRLMTEVVGYFAERAAGGQMICLSYVYGTPYTSPRVPPPTALVDASVARWTNVTADDCPRTYQVMVVRIDSLGAPIIETPPPGHVDPQHLSVGLPQEPDDGMALIAAEVRQGSGGHIYRCSVPVDAPGTPFRCRLEMTWVS